MDNDLRKKVARLVEGYPGEHPLAHLAAEEIADAILSIPEIKEALALASEASEATRGGGWMVIGTQNMTPEQRAAIG